MVGVSCQIFTFARNCRFSILRVRTCHVGISGATLRSVLFGAEQEVARAVLLIFFESTEVCVGFGPLWTDVLVEAVEVIFWR